MARPVLIAGAGGMLGTALRIRCVERGIEHAVPVEADFDITHDRSVRSAVETFAAAHPGGVLVNAAAYTNVERAEDEPDRAADVNDRGAAKLARAACDAGIRFVHVSTDFVFDGSKRGAYAEDDEPSPLSVYGRTKLAGERSVTAALPTALVVRTAWVFGPGGANFPTKILERARHAEQIEVVCDESGSPTYTLDLAAGILDLVDRDAAGLFHLAGTGSCSRDELARAVLRIAGLDDVSVVPVPSSAFPSKARRPANSVLDCSKARAIGVTMPEWHDALARFVASGV